MKRIFKILSLFLLITLPLTTTNPVFAEGTKTPIITEANQLVFDDLDNIDSGKWVLGEKISNQIESNDDEITLLLTTIFTFITLFGGGAIFFTLTFGLASYIYSSLTLQKVADRLGEKNTWYAWVPILRRILFFKMGNQNPFLILLGLIPIIGGIVLRIISIIATCNICEKRGHDKLLGLLSLIPLANLILWGILAWGKDDTVEPKKETEVTKV